MISIESMTHPPSSALIISAKLNFVSL